jgi:hypothetical protein
MFVGWFLCILAINEIYETQFDTQKWMPPAIKLNIVERSYDLSNNLENYTD